LPTFQSHRMNGFRDKQLMLSGKLTRQLLPMPCQKMTAVRKIKGNFAPPRRQTGGTTRRKCLRQQEPDESGLMSLAHHKAR
jgi:hypothetical protein